MSAAEDYARARIAAEALAPADQRRLAAYLARRQDAADKRHADRAEAIRLRAIERSVRTREAGR